MAPFLVSPGGSLLFPMIRYGVFASRWPLGGRTVWTIVNRNPYSVPGPQIEFPFREGVRFFDLYHGVELAPERRGDRVMLSFEIEPKGYGALMAMRVRPTLDDRVPGKDEVHDGKAARGLLSKMG